MSASDDLLRDIIAKLDKLDNLAAGLTKLDARLEAGQSRLEARLEAGQQKLEEGLNERRQLLGAVQQNFGGIVERQLLDEIRHKFGERFAKELLAESIVDLCCLIPEKEEVFSRRKNKAARQLSFIRPATQVGHVEHDLCNSAQPAIPPWHSHRSCLTWLTSMALMQAW